MLRAGLGWEIVFCYGNTKIWSLSFDGGEMHCLPGLWVGKPYSKFWAFSWIQTLMHSCSRQKQEAGGVL